MASKQAPRRSRRQPGITSITYWRKFARHRVIYVGLAGIIGFGIIAYFGTSPFGGESAAREQYLTDSVAVVNGEPIERGDYERQAESARRRSGANQTMVATEEGMILSALVDTAILRREAKQRKLSVTDEDVDKTIAQIRQVRQQAQAKPLTDEEVLQLTSATSMGELRNMIKRDLLPRQFGELLSGSRRLTFADLEKSYDEVEVRHILVGSADSPRPTTKALPDAQAKRRAEKILAELKAQPDFGRLADQYTDDPTNTPTRWDQKSNKSVPSGPPKGGSLGWYKRGGGFDKAFEDAAFALKPGETSQIVKTPFGYHIIKVDNVRRNLPKDYAKNKIDLLESYRGQRTSEALQVYLTENRPKATIVWKDPGLEWRYIYGKSSPYGRMSMQMPDTGDGQQKIIDHLRAYVPKYKSDLAAALVLGQMLYQQLIMAGMPAGIAPASSKKVDRNKLRDEVLATYEIALQHTEDQDTRMTLARLYREAGKPEEALKHYRMTHRLLSWNTGAEIRPVREQLERAFRELGDTVLADEEATKLAEIKAQEEQEQKEARARAAKERAEAAAKAKEKDAGAKTGSTAAPSTAPGPPTSATSGTIELPAPAQEPKKPK